MEASLSRLQRRRRPLAAVAAAAAAVAVATLLVKPRAELPVVSLSRLQRRRRPLAAVAAAAAAVTVATLLVKPRAALPVADVVALPVADVGDFVRRGPLYKRLRSPPPLEEWERHGTALVAELSGTPPAAPTELPLALAIRVYHLYLPIYFWMRTLAGDIRALGASGAEASAVVVGLSAPQGCGKTTLVELLVGRFAADGLRCTSVSIDDFYLSGASVAVPAYDKAARGGRGDRAERGRWREERTPLDVILLEGWMLGFKPRGDSAALRAIHAGLPDIDSQLGAYQAWDDLVDGWCVCALEERRRHIVEWRLQAERAMAAAGRPGMGDAAVRDFVARYMPAYEAYCPQLYASASGNGIDGRPTLLVRVDGTRSPVEGP